MQARDKIDQKSYEYIHSGVKKCEVDELYHPIIEDILIRRTYLYGLPFEQVKKDIIALQRWLKHVEISKFSEENHSFAGFFNYTKKRIRLNEQYIRDCINNGNYEAFYDVFAHELTHALCKDYVGQDILSTRKEGNSIFIVNKFNNNVKNKNLLELIVTELADRLVYKRGKDTLESTYSSQTTGYQASSEIIEMIETAYGVNEKELLNHAINGRMEIARFLSKKSVQEPVETLYELDKFETYYTALHRILYNKSQMKGISAYENYCRFGYNTEKLYNECIRIIVTRIKNSEFSSIIEAQQFCNDLKFDYNRLNYLVQGFAEGINEWTVSDELKEQLVKNGMSGNFKKDLLSTLYENKKGLAKKIIKMENCLKNSDGAKSEEEILEEFNLAKLMHPKDIDDSEYNIGEIEGFSFEIDDETLKRHKVEEVDWDNDEIFDYIKNKIGPKVIEEKQKEEDSTPHNQSDNKSRSIINRIRAIFNIKRIRTFLRTRFFTRKNNGLPEPSDVIEETKTTKRNEFLQTLQDNTRSNNETDSRAIKENNIKRENNESFLER